MSRELRAIAAEPTLESLAADYAKAERDQAPLSPLSERAPGLGLAAAYSIQRAGVAARLAEGERCVGFKIGATSSAIQQALGVPHPLYGVLLGRHLVEGQRVSPSEFLAPRLECELAVGLSADLRGEALTVSEVRAAIAWVAPALEINDPRTRDWKLKVEDVVADNGLAAGVVLGPRQRLGRLDLAKVSGTLREGGQERAALLGAATLGDPLRAVAWLARELSAAGGSLARGQVILTGSLTPLFPLRSSSRWEASFAELGTVRLSVG